MITYEHGDVLQNLENNGKLIFMPHVCNNIPLWGSGIVVGIMNKWKDAKHFHYSNEVKLGVVQYQQVESNVILANMCAQRGLSYNQTQRPLSYEHLVKCMANVRDNILSKEKAGIECEIKTCKFGSLRSGGNWDFIEELIEEIWAGIPTTVFIYEEK